MKKIICLVLICAFAFSFAACSGKSSSADGTDTLRLPYNFKDDINPYSCKSDTNFYLSSLVYDGLYKIGADGEPRAVIAKNSRKDNLKITVNLNDVRFSDDKMVVSDDVVYSFEQAQKSERFAFLSSAFESAESKGQSVVRFTLKKANAYALNLLTFPIVSAGNGLGSGRFKLTDEDGEKLLEFNDKSHEQNKDTAKILLVSCGDYSSAAELYNSGKIDFYFDDIESGKLSVKKNNAVSGTMNNLVFLGLNSKNNALANADFRRGIALLVDRSEIAEKAFEGYALPVSTPISTDRNDMGSIVTSPVFAEDSKAKQAFKDAGYGYDDMGVKLLDKNGKQVKFSIIVNSANNMKIEAAQMIKTRLLACGIDASLKKMPIDEYNVAVVNGNFEMYIGEVKTGNDYNLDCFFTENGGASFGIDSKRLCESYEKFISGSVTLQDFVSVFLEENPFVPICYRNAAVAFSSNLSSDGIKVSDNDIYSAFTDRSTV